MDIHHNALTCPRSRELIIQRVKEQGQSVQDVAQSLGISERTVYKWLARYRAQGLLGLQDRSCRPRRSPRQTPRRDREAICRFRRRRMVAAEIAARLGLARSTVARILQQAGWGRLKNLEPAQPTRRYERDHPGQLLHLDIKKLGKIAGVGHRITGDKRRRARGVGWEFVHVCIDDASRLAYVEVLSDERKHSAMAFLGRAVLWFQERGIRVEEVLTDNGSCYLSHAFQGLCKQLGLRHLRTRPYRPQTNGKAERLIQTLLREWAYRFSYRSSGHRIRWLRPWLHFYNHHRQHQSLGWPASYQQTSPSEQCLENAYLGRARSIPVLHLPWCPPRQLPFTCTIHRTQWDSCPTNVANTPQRCGPSPYWPELHKGAVAHRHFPASAPFRRERIPLI